MKRRRFKKEFRARVALEAIKERKTIAQIASEYKVHPNQVSNWKKKALEKFPELFSDKNEKHQSDSDYSTDELLREVGRLQVELELL